MHDASSSVNMMTIMVQMRDIIRPIGPSANRYVVIASLPPFPVHPFTGLPTTSKVGHRAPAKNPVDSRSIDALHSLQDFLLYFCLSSSFFYSLSVFIFVCCHLRGQYVISRYLAFNGGQTPIFIHSFIFFAFCIQFYFYLQHSCCTVRKF